MIKKTKSNRTLYAIHKEIVDLLKERGEKIFNPFDKGHLTSDGHILPDAYVKGQKYPSNEFLCGTPLWEKDGTISINGDFLSWYVSGFRLEDLGLCDPIVGYKNLDLLKEKPPCVQSTSIVEEVLDLKRRIRNLENIISPPDGGGSGAE
jgi:hypothetical protein